jgi:hemoglobin-like flavoprotein
VSRQSWLIRGSYDLIRDMPKAVAMLFYGRLFDLDPSLRPLFKNDIEIQSQKLMDTLSAAVDSLDNLPALVPALRAMGARHLEYGVQTEHYAKVRDALLWAMAQALQEDFDPETRAAWRSLLDTVIAEMLTGAKGPTAAG